MSEKISELKIIEVNAYYEIVENLKKIVLICDAIADGKEHLTKDDLTGFCCQIRGIGSDAMIYLGVTRDELEATTRALLSDGEPHKRNRLQ